MYLMFLLQVSTCDTKADISQLCKEQAHQLNSLKSSPCTLRDVKRKTRDLFKKKYKQKVQEYKQQIEQMR